MATVKAQVRHGVYHDSVILMQLQRSLSALPGILDAGVVMGTAANKGVLAQSDLLTSEASAAEADDLVIVVRARDDAAAQAGLDQVDQLLTNRRRVAGGGQYRPKSLESAIRMMPGAQWVLISVPGRYAAGLARQAVRLGRNVFLYSDNVSLADETALKRAAAEKGLVVMGPDCGTAIVNGVGLGFANRVRRGPIGLVAASGTGLQQVTSRIHQLRSGISHALGTGGRDLSGPVGAVTTRQGIDLLHRDPETGVIVLISKPPSPEVAEQLLRIARLVDKPTVVDFIGHSRSVRRSGNLRFAATLGEAAEIAVRLAHSVTDSDTAPNLALGSSPLKDAQQVPSAAGAGAFKPGQRYLRGLFSGGTLAYEALLILQDYLPAVYSNVPLNRDYGLADPLVSREHTIIDLGEDEFTVGRLHPMMDNDLRIRRLRQEVDDPDVAVILLDVVLGYGAHPDPARELAPAIAEGRKRAREAGRHLEVVAFVVGTDEDPQDLERQRQQLQAAGALVETSNESAVRHAGQLVLALDPPSGLPPVRQVDLAVLTRPMVAVNVGLEAFKDSLIQQDAEVIHVDWRPPAGGDEKLMAILERLR